MENTNIPILKDIVNRDAVNINNCESEPIHIPGTIQPHGYLIAVDKKSLEILFASENSSGLFQLDLQHIIGKKLFDLLDPAQVSDFEKDVQQDLTDTATPYVFLINNIEYNAAWHQSGSHIVLEFEPFPDGRTLLPDLYNQTKQFTSFLQHADSLESLSQKVAEETRRITGYDRVMIYRFDEQYNGEVLAESKREGLEPFLGLHYPHTDIPVQARTLYMRNLMRMIVDIDYKPVPIFTNATLVKTDNSSLDLSLSILRSVSPIHVEYLQNMGVGGTLTISLMMEGKLWGLITCHHYSKKNIPFYTRLAAQLQGHFLTSQIRVRETADVYEISRELDLRLQNEINKLNDLHEYIGQIGNDLSLASLCNADGVIVKINDRIYKCGDVPGETDLENLIEWLIQKEEEDFSTSCLSDHYPAGKEIQDNAAGIIFHSLNTSNHNCMIWFRREIVHTVNWAGNPQEAIVKSEQMQLSPRKSFELWKQEVRYKSNPWNDPELNMASQFAYTLRKLIYVSDITEKETKYRILSEQLQKAYEELSNLNWISTHDLKEPLRKIQIFATQVMGSESIRGDNTNKFALERMQHAASRMQQLIEDIRAYAILNEKDEGYSDISLNEVVEEVISELSEEIQAKQAVINVKKLPEIKGVGFQISQLFTNLLNNALKFSDDQHPVVEIYTSDTSVVNEGNLYHKVTIEDNGIGFDNMYAEKIFSIFQRLHSNTEYRGTGVGLAICKKIMERHGGYIHAEGQPGKGAKFHLFFPV